MELRMLLIHIIFVIYVCVSVFRVHSASLFRTIACILWKCMCVCVLCVRVHVKGPSSVSHVDNRLQDPSLSLATLNSLHATFVALATCTASQRHTWAHTLRKYACRCVCVVLGLWPFPSCDVFHRRRQANKWCCCHYCHRCHRCCRYCANSMRCDAMTIHSSHVTLPVAGAIFFDVSHI